MSEDQITSGKQLAEFAAELQEAEIQKAWVIMVEIDQKFRHRANTIKNLDALRDETLHRLAEIGILAEVDPSPCFYGQPPIITLIGKVSGDPLHTEGFDHERKAYEVRKATKRGEDYLGQKEPANKPKKK